MELTLKGPGRLDVLLSAALGKSRSQATRLIKEGLVSTLDGTRLLKPSLEVASTLSLKVEEKKPEEKGIALPEEEVKLDFVYKDKDLAVINKPRGMVVHPAPGHVNDTLVNYLFKEEASFDFSPEEGDERPGIVHRIDKDTQGLIAVALNPESEAALEEEVKEHDFHRLYLALVYGDVKDKKFAVDAPLTRPNHTVRKALVDPVKGRPAVTHFEKISGDGKVSLLKCRLETGRTHQIRAHLAYLGYPIVGDPLYGSRKDPMANEGQCLTAYQLSLIHPRTLKPMTFYAPLDEYFKKLLRYFFGPKKK